MSLINDALRRAKQVQRDVAPPAASDTQFRTIDPAAQSARHGVGLLLPALLAAMALLAMLLFWELSHPGTALTSRTPLAVAARSPITSNADTLVEAPPAKSEVPAVTVDSAKAAPAGGPDSAAGSPAASSNLVAAPDAAETNRAAATEAAPPPLKLQGIIFNPRRPSALINGRVIFLGDRVREYRVLAIHRDEVLLAGAGQTNVLSLEP